ncbi:MAG TPA: CPBP family intramembrane metalloprotease, partial [Brevibacterium epidermidis]|nr:CPBP family intramembrane metalloprotease [Brevibacterium epidermidis]
PWPIIISLALFRASYHLYQGIGPFIGNVAMGIIFGWYFLRKGRLMPLVWAHVIIDAVGFLAPGVLALVDFG